MINIGMSHSPSSHDGHHPWTVEFTKLRVANERQQQVANTISWKALVGVLRLWIEAITPSASLVVQDDGARCSIFFETRSQARRFVASFGGKLLPRL